jgi:hypothetical protein
MSEPLVFNDITPIEEPVVVGETKYVLRECNGGAYVQYQNARQNCYVYEDGKLKQVRDIANLEPLLASLTLFMEDGKTLVSEVTIRAWPSRVVRAIHDRAKEISGMVPPVTTLEEQIAELQRQLEQAKLVKDRGKN